MPDNTTVIRDAYQAFAKGDIPGVLAALSTDLEWHVPGRSPLSGTYHSHDGVMQFFGTCQELSNGTLRVELDELLADGERVVALTTVSAERNGRSWSSPEVHVWRLNNGQAIDFREYQGDQQTEDEFWSS
jgi:uncharacterized protein